MRRLYLLLAASIILVLIILGSVLWLSPPGKSLTIISSPQNATIAVNGTILKTKTPVTIPRPRDKKEIVVSVELAGYQAQTLTTQLTSQTNQTISFTLAPLGVSGNSPTPTIPPPYRINPTYVERLKREPFWAMLPRWGPHYKIEYLDSDNVIIITALNGTTAQVEGYREEALIWLKANGANLQTLTVQYVTTK